MSAFIVSDFHINTLINWAVQHDVQVYWDKSWEQISVDPARFAGALYATNVESVNRWRGQDTLLYGFEYRPFVTKVSSIQILKAIDCLDYQSCDLKEWKTTFAYAVLEAIKVKAISSLPGYDEAKWELAAERIPI